MRRNRSALLSLGEQPCARDVADRLGRLMYKLALHKLHKQAMVKHINGFGFAPAAQLWRVPMPANASRSREPAAACAAA